MSLGDDRGMLLLDLKIEMMLESCATDGCLVNYLVKWTPCYQFWKKVVRVKSFLNVRAKRCDGYISFLSFIEREGKVLHDDHWTTFMWLAFCMDQFRHLWCGQEASMGDYVVWVEDGLFWNVVFIVKFPWHTAKGNGFFVTVLAHHANMTILEY